MLESIQALLDAFPEPIIQARGGAVVAGNSIARLYLPQLSPGAPLPECLDLPQAAPSGAGIFSSGTATYSFSSTLTGEDQLILFRPAPQGALTDQQLEGTLRQLRQLLGDLMGEIGPQTAAEPASPPEMPRTALIKSFHQMFRLVRNLEYMQESASSEGITPQIIPMDLDALCRQTVSGAYSLLQKAGVTLEYESVSNGLIIPGDPELLQRLLLGLISNSALAAREGRTVLTLRRQGERALLTLSDSGPLPSPQQLAALFQQGTAEELPLPGQGAGLGLSIARHIVSLHRGSMLVEWGQSAPSTVISLPTGPLPSRVAVRSPRPPQRDAGLSPFLVELSDVLPASAFEEDGLD